MSDFLTFRSYETEDEATTAQTLLNRNNIPNVLSEERALLDSTMIGQQFDAPYRVKVPAEHFSKAEQVLRTSVDISGIDVEPDYYLLSFSTEELKEVIEKKDEWGAYDYALALKLLKEKGITFTATDLEQLHKKRIEVLAAPENGVSIWMLIGYLSALLGGAMGIFIGFILMRARKTLPDGSRAFIYNDRSRAHGMYIAILGIIAGISWSAYAILTEGTPPSLGGIFGLMNMVTRL